MDSRTSKTDMNGDKVLALYRCLQEKAVNGRLQLSAVKNAVLKLEISRSIVTRVLNKIGEADDHLNLVKNLKKKYIGRVGVKRFKIVDLLNAIKNTPVSLRGTFRSLKEQVE